MKRFSVRAHLFILVIAAVLPVVVFSGWLALSISDERRGAVERELHDTARGLAAAVDRELNNTVGTLKILATSRNLERRDFSLFYADARRRLETQRGWLAVTLAEPESLDDPALLANELARLSRVAYAIVWVNPLKGQPEYEPLAGGMRAALPFVDRFLPGHNLESLEALGTVLSGIERRHAA